MSVCLCTSRDDMVDDGKMLAVNYDLCIIYVCILVCTVRCLKGEDSEVMKKREVNLLTNNLILFFKNCLDFEQRLEH